MPKVLIADKLSPAALDIFTRRGVEAVVETGLGPDELIARIGGFEGLAIRSATKVTAEVLDAGGRLKVVGRAGIGVDNVDVAAATSRGVVVMNTPFGNSTTTAEHTIALMMALARQLPAADRSTKAGKWEKARFMGVELAYKTLGMIGCGNIGSIVADRAQGLKMRVAVYDPFLSEERARNLGVEKVELIDLLKRADFITLHTPLTEQTKGIVSRWALAQTKPGVRIVNCARGGLIDEEALAEALVAGHVAGAALDVFAVEPARESPLFELDNVVVTPHLGASTSEAQENVAVQVAEQMADYLTSGAVVNALNMPSITAEEAPRLLPYTKLAEQLGGFTGQLVRSGLRSVTITYAGQVADLNPRPLTATILQGLLRPLMASVNMVNAPALARERNIDVRTVSHERVDGYQTLIRLDVVTDSGRRGVAGTLFQGERPRVVEVNGIPVEAQLGAHMLFVQNDDMPGSIGRLGSLLGESGVNIATFHLGRDTAGGNALALMAVDQPVPDDVLEAIRKLPQVVEVRSLSF